MSETARPPNRIPWPPLIYLAAIAAATGLTIARPLPWIGAPLSDILLAIGWLMVAAVVAIDVTAMRTLMAAKTTIMPHRASANLVTGGPFALTRNPIYLANTMLVVAIGLIAGAIWFLVAAPAAAFLTQKLSIGPEERHLEARFGKKYRDYAKRVRRWI